MRLVCYDLEYLEKISEMLGNSDTLVTRHYLGGMNLDETFDTNKTLF